VREIPPPRSSWNYATAIDEAAPWPTTIGCWLCWASWYKPRPERGSPTHRREPLMQSAENRSGLPRVRSTTRPATRTPGGGPTAGRVRYEKGRFLLYAGLALSRSARHPRSPTGGGPILSRCVAAEATCDPRNHHSSDPASASGSSTPQSSSVCTTPPEPSS